MCYDQAKTQAPMDPRRAPRDFEVAEKLMHDQIRESAGQIGREMSDEDKIQQLFTHHPPTPYTGPRFETIRSAAKHLAEIICANVPRGADRSAAIRKVREAVMTANAGISLEGLSL